MGVTVMGKEKDVNDYYHHTEKMALIREFLDQAIQYCTVLKIEGGFRKASCVRCGDETIDNGQEMQCLNCGTVSDLMEVEDHVDHGDKKIVAKKTGVADNIKNFRDIINQFEVTSNINIPARIIDTIRENIVKYRSFSIEELTKPDLVMIMKAAKINSMWFKHLNKIYFILTGKKPVSINPYITNLMRRIEWFAEIHNQVKDPDRSNFIHGLHIFWMFLMNEGYPANPDDFILLKSREVEMNNIKTIEKGFKILRKTHPEYQWKIFEFA